MGLNLDKSGKKLLPPTIGRIAIGKKEGNRPVKVDHFLFTKPVTASEDFAPIDVETTEVMKKKYGEKPRNIKVVLPFHHPDEVFFTSLPKYLAALAARIVLMLLGCFIRIGQRAETDSGF